MFSADAICYDLTTTSCCVPVADIREFNVYKYMCVYVFYYVVLQLYRRFADSSLIGWFLGHELLTLLKNDFESNDCLCKEEEEFFGDSDAWRSQTGGKEKD